mgnify:CR=1 FL=1
MFERPLDVSFKIAEKLKGIPVAVVITTHDSRSEYCLKAVTSILAQTYQDINIYIVFDGPCTDGTFDLIKMHLDTLMRDKEHIDRIRPIKYIEYKEKVGKASILRNEGIRHVVKDGIPLVNFLDSDNLFLRDHIKTLYAIILEGYDLVYANRNYISAIPNIDIDLGYVKQMPFMGKMDVSYGRILRGDLAKVNFIDSSDLMITTRSLVEIGGWNEDAPKSRWPDWDLVYRYWKANYPIRCFEFPTGPNRIEMPPLTSYLWHSDNLGQIDKNTSEEQFRNELKNLTIFRNHLDDCKKYLPLYNGY